MSNTSKMLSDEEANLIIYNVGVLKNVMRDIQKYGIEWLEGSDRESKAIDLIKYNKYLNNYEEFIRSLHDMKDFYEVYTYLYNTSAIFLWELLLCLDGLEVLMLHITKSMTKICYDTDNIVTCAHSIIRQNYILEDLYSSSWILLSCSRTGLLKILQNTQYKIDFLNLNRILHLDTYIAKVIYKCQVIKDTCPNRVLGYNNL